MYVSDETTAAKRRMSKNVKAGEDMTEVIELGRSVLATSSALGASVAGEDPAAALTPLNDGCGKTGAVAVGACVGAGCSSGGEDVGAVEAETGAAEGAAAEATASGAAERAAAEAAASGAAEGASAEAASVAVAGAAVDATDGATVGPTQLQPVQSH